MERFLIQAEPADNGERLDVFAVRGSAGLSRSHIQKLIADGHIVVNGRPVKANYKLQTGDQVNITVPSAQPVELVPEAINLDILYEDKDVIVINKARGMVVHPAAGNYSGTLVNALLGHCRDLSGINGEVRPGIVHRLDKDTSGVMVAAKTDRAHIHLAEQIKERTATRKYYVLVHGNIAQEQGVIDAPIGRHPNERKKMAVTFQNSKTAVTRFKVMKRFRQYSLVECSLLTGRTHQIRVHMAHIGHPVVGDPVYGPKKRHFKITGQALHSAQLQFQHPATGEVLTFTAPMPEDMADIITTLEQEK